MSLIYTFIFLLLAFLGTPLFVLILAITLFLFVQNDINPIITLVEMLRLANAPTLMAIPLFTFAGFILAEAKTAKRLVNLSRAVLGQKRGSLALVTLITCAFFTAFTGASGVTIVALGGLLFPALLKEKYKEPFSLGLLTTGGSLGLLFPPSLPLILYGIVAKVNIDQLFLAGIIPGILLVLALSFYSRWKGQAKEYKAEKSDLTVGAALKDAAWELPLPFIILVGIYGGFFTATEAAAVTAFYVLVIEFLIYKDLSFKKDLLRIGRESMVMVGGILIILAAALGLTNYFIDEEIPQQLLESMQQVIQNKWVFLAALNVFLLLVGSMMDIFSAIIVVVPLITPIALQYGIDPVHLGIIFLANLELGYSTPPVGINLFIASFRFKKDIWTLYRASLPFLLLLLICVILITYVPQLSLILL